MQGEFGRENELAWDRMAGAGHALATPVNPDELRDPLSVVDEIGWLGGDIRGQKVLCLAAGGGRHGPLYRAAGGEVTVVDVSGRMLELDREACRLFRLDVRLIQGDMRRLSMLNDQEFDLVVQPVSTCYVEELNLVYREVARVLRPGGLYISQHKQPANLQVSIEPVGGSYAFEVPVQTEGNRKPTANAIHFPSRLREPGTTEYVHSLQSILGGMCRAGFVIEDFAEPQHGKLSEPPGSFGHRCAFVPPYLRIKARRVGQAKLAVF